MGDEFHAVLKLITGEEIFALVSVDENDGDSIIMLSNPVIMKMIYGPHGQYVKIRPWLDLPNEDLFLIKYDKIITMSEVSDENLIICLSVTSDIVIILSYLIKNKSWSGNSNQGLTLTYFPAGLEIIFIITGFESIMIESPSFSSTETSEKISSPVISFRTA